MTVTSIARAADHLLTAPLTEESGKVAEAARGPWIGGRMGIAPNIGRGAAFASLRQRPSGG